MRISPPLILLALSRSKVHTLTPMHALPSPHDFANCTQGLPDGVVDTDELHSAYTKVKSQTI